MNLDNYNAILGITPPFQHEVAVGINPSCIAVGSDTPVEPEGPEVITISSAAADLLENGLDEIRTELRAGAEEPVRGYFKNNTPPLRTVSHTIPLIDEHRMYRFRPSKCPEAFGE